MTKTLELEQSSKVGEVEEQEKFLSPSMETALRLWSLGGFTLDEAAKEAGVSIGGLYRAKYSKEGVALIRRLRELIDEEFQNKALKVLSVIDSALEHVDPKIQLAGANIWCKYFKPQVFKVEHTIEDFIKEMMERK